MSMTAEPIGDEDPSDPQVILRDLPETEHAEFLRQYHQAVDAAREPEGYQRLRFVLRAWSVRAKVVSRPGYYEQRDARRAAIADGTLQTVDFFDALDAELARRHP
jgi:hypothetical protein